MVGKRSTYRAFVDAKTYARFGGIGESIEGSRYVRDYCYRCGRPIRVLRTTWDNGMNVRNNCEKCHPDVAHYVGLTPRQEHVRGLMRLEGQN